MIVGCYYLTLYCDGIEDAKTKGDDYMRHYFPDQYGPVSEGGKHQAHDIDATGKNVTEATRATKQAGWVIKSEKAYCPGCVELGRHK